MKDLVMFIRRFASNYKKYFLLSILFNIITAFFTIFSFAFLIPILQMLFGISEKKVYHLMEWGDGSLQDVAINNFYYFTDQLINTHGQSFTLAVLAGILICMTILKTGTYYLS
ncbi:MAG: ABC transporter ATP-binding protein, partial [Muribaculaceae bacterium]|nr:ABC transporter ATP-binding protein [Muribaculaceae bacterium]